MNGINFKCKTKYLSKIKCKTCIMSFIIIDSKVVELGKPESIFRIHFNNFYVPSMLDAPYQISIMRIY